MLALEAGGTVVAFNVTKMQALRHVFGIRATDAKPLEQIDPA